MAIPVLYWMLECTACGSRLVVHDSYFEFVGISDSEPLEYDGGYGDTPLPERYKCTKGCSWPIKTIGSIWSPYDVEMRLHDPYVRVKMTKAQSDEWRQLIQVAGLAEVQDDLKARRRAWWRIW